MTPNTNAFIAVHAGAGYHSVNKEKEYRHVCSQSCLKAMDILRRGGSALDGLLSAIQCLEDSPCCNAGLGSSLTMEGTVECDASVMDGQSLMFGAVGCLSGVKNPIGVARKLLDEQKNGILSLGRIPPRIMVGEGAYSWARQHNIPAISPDILKSDSAVKTYENHKRRLQRSEERRDRKRQKMLSQRQQSQGCTESDEIERSPQGEITSEMDDLDDLIQDTVGAVCMDCHGNLASGVSSGGISLKQPGRIGLAAVYGAGCWAYNWRNSDKPGVAIATSGCGEHIMGSLLARECADRLQKDDMASSALNAVFRDNFLESEFLAGTDEKFGGALVLKQVKEDARWSVELLTGHTTASMSVGYMSSRQNKPKTLISRLSEDKRPGKSFTVEGKHFYL